MGSKETLMGPALSRKSGHGLMQNCDLPPPLKVFTGPNQAMFSSIKNQEEEDNEFPLYDEKLDLLKALRLSQTRAREAERKAAGLIKERDMMSNALIEESMRLYAFRKWVRLLEVQVTKLQSQEKDKENESEGQGSITCIIALAFCFGIAGVGFVFGCRCLV